jgi:ATP-binding protein involved in chromosome partitioning
MPVVEIPGGAVPLTDADVIEALRPVRDPALGRSVVELGIVRPVAVRGSEVSLRLAWPFPDEGAGDLADDLAATVAGAVRDRHPEARVTVTVDAMDDGERAALAERLRAEGGTGPGGRFGPRTRVLAISSGKGGVGKSSVTVNLAVALAGLGHEVAVLDADVYGFSVPRMLGVDRPPLVLDGLIIPPVAHGVRCISMGFFVAEDQPVIWRGPMLHKALEQFLTDVWWGAPAYVLVDMPPGTGDVALSMAQHVPRAEVIVVTTPQPAAQSVAQRSALMAEKVRLSVLGVIENMSGFTADDGTRYELFGAGGGDALAARLGVPLIGRVPLDPLLREGGDEGRPVTVAHPGRESARAFVAMAERIAGELAPRRIWRPELTVR